MAPYDSDSSGAEDDDFTETNVLLGYASEDANGEEISRLGGLPDWLDSGKPASAALAKCKVCKDFMVLLLQLNAELPDRFPGHERRLYVLACRRKSCRRKDGSIRAIRGVRISPELAKETKESAPAKAPAPAPKPASQGLGEALFGVKPATAASGAAPRANPFLTSSSIPSSTANPFAPKPPSPAAGNPFSQTTATSTTPSGDEPAPVEEKDITTSAATSNLPKTFAETLSLNNTDPQPTTYGPPPPPEPWPEPSSLPPPYPVRWLADAEYETLDPAASTALPSSSNVNLGAMDIDSSAGEASSSTGGGGGGKEDKEVFESSMDSTFQKFADRVGQNPEQCIRYEFGGQPLLYAKGDEVSKIFSSGSGSQAHEKVKVAGGGGGGGAGGRMPRCGNCGAGRVFEVQMMPHAIEELEVDEEGMEGMDWGTIIVGVCERDCQERGVAVGEAGYLEEWAGVQWEELTMKRQ
ncbi:hypothetical protein VTK26DRAFT_4260 [Humicola hyalothermophila]